MSLCQDFDISIRHHHSEEGDEERQLKIHVDKAQGFRPPGGKPCGGEREKQLHALSLA